MSESLLKKLKETSENPCESSLSELTRALIREGYPEKLDPPEPPPGVHEFSFTVAGLTIVARLLSLEQECSVMSACLIEGERDHSIFIQKVLEESLQRVNGVGYRTPEQREDFNALLRSWSGSLQRHCFKILGEERERYETSLNPHPF